MSVVEKELKFGYDKLIDSYVERLNAGDILISATDTLLSYFASYTNKGYIKLLEYAQDKEDLNLMPVMYCGERDNDILGRLLERETTELEDILIESFVPHIILITRKANGEKIAIRSTKLKILQDIIRKIGGAVYAMEINLLKIKPDEMKRLESVMMITNQYTELSLSTYSNFHSCIVDISQIDEMGGKDIIVKHDYAINMKKFSEICNEYKLFYRVIPGSMLTEEIVLSRRGGKRDD